MQLTSLSLCALAQCSSLCFRFLLPGYSCRKLKADGCSAKNLVDTGCSAKNWRRAGYCRKSVMAAGCSTKNLVNAGYSMKTGVPIKRCAWLAGEAEEMVKLETMVKTKREGERASRSRGEG